MTMSSNRQDSADVEEKWLPYKVTLVPPFIGPDSGNMWDILALEVYLK
jgi:hypothetical protein